ncbi:MAG: gliding motility-associated C-terminal domain-containing protein, partial [Chitinophagales bacterium]
LAPTGFSPDASGKNDVFRIVTTCEEGFSSFELGVYNRWGELIYYTTDSEDGWDGMYKGREVEIGTYIYVATYIKNLGDGKEEVVKGNLTILR